MRYGSAGWFDAKSPTRRPFFPTSAGNPSPSPRGRGAHYPTFLPNAPVQVDYASGLLFPQQQKSLNSDGEDRTPTHFAPSPNFTYTIVYYIISRVKRRAKK